MLPLGEANQNNIESSVHRFYKGSTEESKFSLKYLNWYFFGWDYLVDIKP